MKSKGSCNLLWKSQLAVLHVDVMRYTSPHGGRYPEVVMVPTLITGLVFKQGKKKQIVYDKTQFAESCQRTSLV